MGKQFPFDEKNARDFLENTRKINEALETIEGDLRLAPSKANLARLSGLNRNTLYNRSLMTCPKGCKDLPNAADFGWPYKRLLEIKKGRKRLCLDQADEPTREQSLEHGNDQLQKALVRSRHVAAFWFNRTLDLKKERDVARREAELLRKQIGKSSEAHREEVIRLREQLQKNIKAVKT